jgi:hypothetical protein
MRSMFVRKMEATEEISFVTAVCNNFAELLDCPFQLVTFVLLDGRRLKETATHKPMSKTYVNNYIYVYTNILYVYLTF